jgi:hypothetical protein
MSFSSKNSPAKRAFSMASMRADIASGYVGYFLQRAFLGEASSKRKLKSVHTRGEATRRNVVRRCRRGQTTL